MPLRAAKLTGLTFVRFLVSFSLARMCACNTTLDHQGLPEHLLQCKANTTLLQSRRLPAVCPSRGVRMPSEKQPVLLRLEKVPSYGNLSNPQSPILYPVWDPNALHRSSNVHLTCYLFFSVFSHGPSQSAGFPMVRTRPNFECGFNLRILQSSFALDMSTKLREPA